MLPSLANILTTLAARAVAMVGPLVVSVITARALGPEDRGQYFLVMSYAMIAAQIANLGLHVSNTYLAASRRELVGRLLVNGLYVAMVVAPIVALAIALLLGWPQALGIAASSRTSVGPLALAAALIAPMILMLLFVSNLAVAVGRIFLFNAMTIGYSVLAVVSATAVWSMGGAALSFLLAAAASATITCFVASRHLQVGQHLSARFDLRLFREGLFYAFKAYLTTMFGFLMMRVGILALQHQASLTEVGLFSIAVQLSDGLAQLPATIGVLLFPMMLRTKVEHRRRAMWRAFWGLGGTMLGILVIAGIALQWLIPLLFGAAFVQSFPLTIAMFPQLLLLSLITVISQYLAAEGYPWTQVFAWVVGFIVQTGLSYWLASLWGGLGVAFSLTVSCGLVLIMLLFEVFRKRETLCATINAE
jgi:O-antigen/teichoic acid export membrane protein